MNKQLAHSLPEAKPCATCNRTRSGDCSHGACPRRRAVTAQIADGHSYCAGTGLARAVPTKQGNDS